MIYHMYDKQTLQYAGAVEADSNPETDALGATTATVDGLTSNIFYQPATNTFTGNKQNTEAVANQPNGDQLMMMNVMKQVAAQNVQIAALQKAMGSTDTAKGANA